jgi:hypothetical protein
MEPLFFLFEISYLVKTETSLQVVVLFLAVTVNVFPDKVNVDELEVVEPVDVVVIVFPLTV